MNLQVSFDYQLFDNELDLEASLQTLLAAAREATMLSYAPYSHFHVGAALLLSNGQIVKGSNQENASFPAGICAERVALSTASSLYPGVKIAAIGIAYHSSASADLPDNILSPCGICRQSLLEVTDRQQEKIKVILSSTSGKIILLENAAYLLPLAFSASNL
ncbi:cytidine deaminase [Dyadobacter arcticus]|uniref:Cytidine deaminase n=1 Tax=Dyadobacter arcticus TaxID=1078754 RepID=A0ABX0UNS4_9BACT|nr:cytidine deaminase [Dyadobacter arcticus]NIJ53789.1 cytidine deaminase [Dyadobacter arcticus]